MLLQNLSYTLKQLIQAFLEKHPIFYERKDVYISKATQQKLDGQQIAACKHEQEDCLKVVFLLKRGANPEYRCRKERTPLHWASSSGDRNEVISP